MFVNGMQQMYEGTGHSEAVISPSKTLILLSSFCLDSPTGLGSIMYPPHIWDTLSSPALT